MDLPVNRAELLHRSWKQQEEKMLGFGAWSSKMNKEILRQQHSFISAGLNRISIDEQLHEKSYVGLLKVAVRGMEKALYPNPVFRFFVRLKAQFILRPAQIKQFKMMKEENIAQLKSFMIARGFGTLVAGLEKEMDFERNWFGMRMSGELEGGRRIEMELELARDLNGRYHPTLIDATLVEADGKRLSHDFLLTDALDAPMVVNLMQGRAVCVTQSDGKGAEVEKWLQLHFEKGDSYLRNFNLDYGFSVEDLLRDLSVGFGMPGLSDQRLVEELQKGNQISFIAGSPINGKLLIQADPSQKCLAIGNGRGEKLELQALMDGKKAHELKMVEGLAEISIQREQGKSNGPQIGLQM